MFTTNIEDYERPSPAALAASPNSTPGQVWADEHVLVLLFGYRGNGYLMRALTEQIGAGVTKPDLAVMIYGSRDDSMVRLGTLFARLGHYDKRFGYKHWPFAVYDPTVTASGEWEYEILPETALQVRRLLGAHVDGRIATMLRADLIEAPVSPGG